MTLYSFAISRRSPRIARIVVAGLPHHVTQRGNRDEAVFFGDDDDALYRDLLAERCRNAAAACRAYCPMPNHVRPSLVPRESCATSTAHTYRVLPGAISPAD